MVKKNTNLLLIVLFILLGIAISLQFRAIMKENSDSFAINNKYGQLKIDLENEKKRVEMLKDLIDERQKDIVEHEKAAGKKDKRLERIRKELEKTDIMAGGTDVTGSGVIITLNDAEVRKDDNVNPNDELVHDMDIVEILNELKIAKAQALSVNEERIIAISEQTCAGPTISVNRTRSATPFVIKAVGNPDNLMAQLERPESIVKILELNRIQVKIETSEEVKILKYKGDFSFFLKKAGVIYE